MTRNSVHARKDYDNVLSEEFEARLHPGEPVIVFRGQDKYFTEVVDFYRQSVVSQTERFWKYDEDMTPEGEEFEDGMEAFEQYSECWQIDNREHVKEPDVPSGQMRLEY